MRSRNLSLRVGTHGVHEDTAGSRGGIHNLEKGDQREEGGKQSQREKEGKESNVRRARGEGSRGRKAEEKGERGRRRAKKERGCKMHVC